MRNIIIIVILGLVLRLPTFKINNLSDLECVSMGPLGISRFWEVMDVYNLFLNINI